MITEKLKHKSLSLFYDSGRSLRRNIFGFIRKRKKPKNFIASRINRSINISIVTMEGIIKEINSDLDYITIDLKEKGKENKFYSFTFPINIVKDIDHFQEDDIISLQARLDMDGAAEEVVLKKIETQNAKIQFYNDYAGFLSQ